MEVTEGASFGIEGGLSGLKGTCAGLQDPAIVEVAAQGSGV